MLSGRHYCAHVKTANCEVPRMKKAPVELSSIDCEGSYEIKG